MTYLILLVLTMIISIVFSIQPIENTYMNSYLLFISPILLFTILGLIKQRKTRIKYLILATSIYYLITAYCTLQGMITSYYILIPLALIPILTSKHLKHTGLGNRMGMAFWLFVVSFMSTLEYESLRPYALTICVLISYCLETYTLHTSEIAPLELHTPLLNRKIPITEYNPNPFEKPKH